jgi:hypothetical protein
MRKPVSTNPVLQAMGFARAPAVQRSLHTKPSINSEKAKNRARAKAARASRKRNR